MAAIPDKFEPSYLGSQTVMSYVIRLLGAFSLEALYKATLRPREAVASIRRRRVMNASAELARRVRQDTPFLGRH